MFYLEFLRIDDFGKHLQSASVREAFVFFKKAEDATRDLKFRGAIFTARVNDYIALCAWSFHYEANLSPEDEHLALGQELERLVERFQRYNVEVIKGRWVGTPPSNLSGDYMV